MPDTLRGLNFFGKVIHEDSSMVNTDNEQHLSFIAYMIPAAYCFENAGDKNKDPVNRYDIIFPC